MNLRPVFSTALVAVLMSLLVPAKAQDPGTAISFNGANGQMGSIASQAPLNAFPLTISCWLKTSQVSTNAGGLVSKYADGSLSGYGTFLYQGRFRGWYFMNPSRYVWDGGQGMDGGFVADGKWHHLAMRIDSTGGRLFVDGVQTASQNWFGAFGATTTTQPLQIGRYSNYPTSLIGELDEISVWSNIQVPADLRRAPLVGNEVGLVAYWKADEGGGTLLDDASPNNRDATLSGGVAYVPSGVLFGSHVTVTLPGIGDEGGQDIIVSDAANPDPAYNREGLRGGATMSFYRPSSGPAETINYEVAMRLIDQGGDPLPLAGGGTEVVVPQSVTFAAGSALSQLKQVHAVLTPESQVDPAVLVRVEAIVRREIPGAPGNFSEQTRRNNDGFQYWHFASEDSADLADNVLGMLGYVDIPQRIVIGSRLPVNVLGTLRRYDGFADLAPNSKSFDVSFTPHLIDLTAGGTELALTGGEQTLPIQLDGFVEGIPRTPTIATPTPTLQVETNEDFPPANIYRVTVDMSWTEADGITHTVTAASQDGPLVVLSGKLFFGNIETTFTSLGGLPVDVGGGKYQLNVTAAHITGFPTHTFVGNPVVTIDPVTRDATVVNAINILVNGPATDEGNAFNVRFRRGQITLNVIGASAEITLRLPAGFGVAVNPNSRRVRGSLVLNTSLNQTLNPSSPVIPLTNPYQDGDFYPVLERLPHWFQTSVILWDTLAGTFDFTPNASTYVRESELATIEAHAPNLYDPAAVDRFSNEGYHRFASYRPGEIVRVTADVDGHAVVDAKLDIAANQGFTAHFPQGLATSWTDPGSLEIANGGIDTASSNLNGVGGTVLAYAQGCPMPPGCPVAGLNPIALVSFAPDGAQWNFTPDGGLRADGTTRVGGAAVDLKWGAKLVSGATGFTHRANGFTNGAALVAGHVLAGDAALSADVTQAERPSALLFSGFGSPGDAAREERPRTSGYAEGFADYAGINFRVGTDNAYSGVSYIGDKPFGPYGIKGISKYYIRRGGVSGIHDVITADVLPAPQVYGYQLTLDGLRLSYRDSANVDSATAGSIFLPFPSLIDVAFSRLLLTCQGDLMTADLTNPGTKTLAYWGIAIQPKTMEFRTAKDAGGCPTGTVKFLTLGSIGSMPAITADPLYAALGIRPNGQLVTAGDIDAKGSGLDSRFTMPNTIRIKGDNGGSYPLTISTKAALNDFASGQAQAPVGFVSFAGSLNVPFFEDVKVHVHANPAGGNPNSLVYLMGGWPNDAKAGSGLGWDEAGKNFFTDAAFDAGNRGYPAGVSLADYRNYPDAADPRYHPLARKVWPGVVTMEYPLAWSPGRRAFKGFKSDRDTLMIIAVDHQVQDLTSSGCSITFGAEFATPRLNVSDLVAGQLNLGSGLASALSGVVDVNSLVGGVENLDRFVTDRVSKLIEAPMDTALAPVATEILGTLSQGYTASANSFSFCSNPAALNVNKPTLETQLGGLLSSGGPLLGELSTTLDRAIDGCDTALSLIGSPGSRGKILTTVSQLAAVSGTNASDPSGFIAQAEASLGEAQRVVSETRVALVETRDALNSGGPVLAELRKAVTDSIATAGPKALSAVCRRFLEERNAYGNYFAEHSDAELKTVISRILKDNIFGDVLAQRLQSVLRARFADLRGSYRAGLDLAFGEINRILNKAAGDLTGELFAPLAAAGGGTGVGDFMGAAKIDGYAQIDGEKVEEVRINAKLQMKVPDEFTIDAFVRILNVDSDTPNTSCRPPGSVKTEVTVGAHGSGTFGIIPVDASIEGKFSFNGDDNHLTGLDGSLDIHSKLAIQKITLERVALKFGFGSGEAYISALVAGKVDFVAAQVFAFFGQTRNPKSLDLIDRDTRALIAAHNIDPVTGCFTDPLIGFYLGAEVTISINEFFRIPDTCLLSLHGIAGSGSFVFIQNNEVRVGYRTLLGIDGELICLVHVHGEAAYALSYGIPVGGPDGLFGDLADLSISGVGRLSVSAEIGVCPFCVDFSKDFQLRVSIQPSSGVSVEFD